ncbi:hypothetical protein [Bartonella sp. AU18XJBT]|nr:hypothetical protein [Bartonella sp. AU18XJBT]
MIKIVDTVDAIALGLRMVLVLFIHSTQSGEFIGKSSYQVFLHDVFLIAS